jgi:uncharacterized tellurite resistance protein B-like protein
MDDSTRVKVCRLVAGILFADREIEEAEAAFLQRMRARFQLPRGTAIDPVVDHDAAVRELGALAPAQREEALDLLVAAAAADGTVSPAERAWLERAAEALGMEASSLEARIEREIATFKPQPFGLAAKQRDDL